MNWQAHRNSYKPVGSIPWVDSLPVTGGFSEEKILNTDPSKPYKYLVVPKVNKCFALFTKTDDYAYIEGSKDTYWSTGWHKGKCYKTKAARI